MRLILRLVDGGISINGNHTPVEVKLGSFAGFIRDFQEIFSGLEIVWRIKPEDGLGVYFFFFDEGVNEIAVLMD